MEKLNQDYRDELARKLLEIRSSDPENPAIAKAKAQGYLDAKKESEEYKAATRDALLERQVRSDLESFATSAEDDLKAIGLSWNGSFSIDGEDIMITFTLDDFVRLEPPIEFIPTGSQRRDGATVRPGIGTVSFLAKIRSIFYKHQDLLPRIKHSEDSPYLNIVFAIDGVKMNSFLFYDGNKWSGPSSNGRFFISSKRFKEEIIPLEKVIEKLGRLRGVSFKWKSNGDAAREIGVIAEEVAEEFPELVFVDRTGEPLGVHYDKFVAVLIEAVKDLDERLRRLER